MAKRTRTKRQTIVNPTRVPLKDRQFLLKDRQFLLY
jgi:hypothetical protein